MKRIAIYTLGCKVNQYESEAVLELFEHAGYQPVAFEDTADVYLINTCTVTHLSDRKSRQMIRRAKHVNPNAIVAVMGCYAQTASNEVAGIPGVDIVVGTSDRARIVELVEQAQVEHASINIVSDITQKRQFEELPLATYNDRTRAFLKVQDGCDQYCSYCIIPYARGHIRSRAPEEVVRETQRLAQNGFCEVVLTGIHIASYGRDLGNVSLLELIQAVHKVEGIERIRMSSVEPTLFTNAFVAELSRLPKVCPHFHLSLQSGCTDTLARMNRRYTAAEYAQAVARLRAALPDVAITTDIMVGFPGETQEEFAQTLQFVEQMRFADAHVFKYSVRQGTKAAQMDGQISPQSKEARSKQIIALTQRHAAEFRQAHIGRIMPVLFEQRCHGNQAMFEGKTENYLQVAVPTEQNLSGCIRPVNIIKEQDSILIGTLEQ